jgi:cytochrome c553
VYTSLAAVAIRATQRPSRHIEIVKSRTGQHYPLTAERDCLGFKQAPLAGALCERTIGANDPVPWCLASIGKAQDIARQARRARRNIAVGTDKAWRDRSHSAQNRSVTIGTCVSCHQQMVPQSLNQTKRSLHIGPPLSNRAMRHELARASPGMI